MRTSLLPLVLCAAQCSCNARRLDESGDTSVGDGDGAGDGAGDGDGDGDATGDGDGDGDPPDCETPPDGMVCVPSGEFIRGSEDFEDSESPQTLVYLDAFFIDVTEVTAGDYNSCVEAGACEPTGIYPTHCYSGDPDLIDYPANCVTWIDAKSYCSWVGKRLPTEAEWEKAARGVDGRLYPWGDNPPSCDLAVWNAGGEVETRGCEMGTAAPVGSRPEGASPFGLLDMAGNVDEFVEDKFDSTYYETCPQDNPPGPDPNSDAPRVVRGGNFVAPDPDHLRTAYRSFAIDDYSGRGVGFRCAKDLAAGR